MKKTYLEICFEQYIKSDKKYEQYEQNVEYFIKYIVEECKKGDTIAKIELNDFFSSIKYNKESCKINAETTAASYFEAVKSFYSYLCTQGYSNDIFQRATMSNDFNLFIKNLKLKPKKEREFFSNQIIKEVLIKLDNYLDNDKNIGKYRYDNWSKLRIFIKFMLIAPAKKKVISQIKIKDIDFKKHTISINNIEIDIPNSLFRDIRKYLNLRENEDDIFLFDEKDTYGNINGWLYSFLREYNIIDLQNKDSNTYSIEVFQRTSLKNLAAQGSSPIYLSLISDTSVATLKKYYKNDYKDIELNYAINNEIHKLKYYKYI